MIKLLHFADTHIDLANYGPHDPKTGLPIRVMDFLKSLDTIVNTAIEEKVDLVLFAGDAYKDRNPAPTFQREWERRMMRLSRAGIPTLLLVGNHDLPPSLGRANALAEFGTLDVPHIKIIDKPQLITPPALENLPIQVIAIPWLSRARIKSYLNLNTRASKEIYQALENYLAKAIEQWLNEADPDLPIILTAHASLEGAAYGGERGIMLGEDLILPDALVRNPQLDYVALGHIHKSQNLTPEGDMPPIVYPGSIERVGFEEALDEKFFVIAEIERGNTKVNWRKLDQIRPFFDEHLKLESSENIAAQLREALPAPEALQGAIVRLLVEYPRVWSSLLDEAVLEEHRQHAFEFHFLRRPLDESRLRLQKDQTLGSLSPLELLNQYWHVNHTPSDEAETLNQLASEIIDPKGLNS